MKTKFFIILMVFLFLIEGCNSGVLAKSYSGFYMDTIFDLKLYSKQRGDKVQWIAKKAFEKIKQIEAHYSVTKPHSLISHLNMEKRVQLSGEDRALFGRIMSLSRQLNGAFDISIYPVMLAWGFTTKHYTIPSSVQLKKALMRVDYSAIKMNSNTIQLLPNMEVDLGGVVKGYTVDQVCDFLQKQGISAGLVNAGGNIKVFGHKPDGSPWVVGIRHPRKASEIYEIISLEPGMAISTSGDYERYFITNGIRYHHIMDPKTGYPVRNGVVSLSVISHSGETADLLSTALFVKGKDEALKYARQHNIPILVLMQTETGITNFQTKNWPQTLDVVERK